MAAIIAALPGDSGNNYTLPTAVQLSTWNTVLDSLIQGNYLAAATAANSLNYDLVQLTDTFLVPNRVYYILRNNTVNYWGTYVYYPNYKRPLVIQSPHAKKDANTGHQGAYVFRQTESMLYMLSGTHRCNSNVASSCTGTTTGCSATSQPYPVSDMAHDVNSVFQMTTEVFLNYFTNTHFIQLHGFTKLSTDPYVILSNGTQVTPSPDYMGIFKTMLYNEDTVLTFKVAHLDLSWTRLRGFWNTQGRLINASPNPCNTSATNSQGRFFHVEQERIRLRSTVSGWTKISNALINTFITTPLAVEIVNFNAYWQMNHADIKWTTKAENNASHFVIERSNNGIDFYKIGEQQAKGLKNETNYYGLNDYKVNDIPTDKFYYRLKLYDNDGQFMYSNIVSLEKVNTEETRISPNPVSNKLYVLSNNNKVHYAIYSMQGQRLLSGKVKGNQAINVSSLEPSIYFLNVNGAMLKFVKK